MKARRSTLFLARAAVIAGAYVALTLALAPLSYSGMQLRLSEALCVLAYFSPSAVAGLTVGCALANLASPYGLLDVAVGTAATLIASLLAYFLPKGRIWKALVPVWSALSNGVLVGLMLTISAGAGENFGAIFLANALSVGLSQLLVCSVAGLPLLWWLDDSELGHRYLG